MRVLLATQGSERGSTSRTLEAWARLLPGQGIRVAVTVGKRGPLLDELRIAGIPTFVRGLRAIPHWQWPFPFAAAVGRLAITLRRSGARIIHVNEHDSHRVAATAARLVRVPIVTHLRFRPEPEYCRWLFKPPYAPDLLLFTSRTQMSDSARAIEPVVPPDRWRLVPNGLDFSRYGTDPHHRDRLRTEWRLPDDAIALGIACAISPRKRVDHFVRLIAALRRRGVPAYGFIAGMAYYPEHQVLLASLRERVADLGLSEYVRFLGYVEPSEPLWYAWDISISTSSYETFGMSVLEAMACRCPVVAYPGGSVQEVAGDAAVIVPDGDEAALFEVALRLCGDRTIRREAGERARAHAQQHYDVRRIVPVLAAEYRAVAA